jgi:invasion protein IalB
VVPAGVQIKIDEGEPIQLQYGVCFPTSCQVQMDLSKEVFDKMRKGKQMVVATLNVQQKTMAFPVQLNGFSKTFD